MEIKFILPSVSKVEQEPGFVGLYRAVERAAKVTTHTERMSDDSEKWVERLIDKGHMRPLEFGTVYLEFHTYDYEEVNFFRHNRYSHVCFAGEKRSVTTNLRVLVENNKEYLLETDAFAMSNNIPNQYHKRRYTILWENIGRDIADEFRTHTSISSLMESTRYCRYTAEKFGDCMKFALPSFGSEEWLEELRKAFSQSAKYYERLLSKGCPVDYARKVIPLDVAVNFIQCATFEQWNEFFKQRALGKTGEPHPDAKYIAQRAASILI